jgi:hypothetical protein
VTDYDVRAFAQAHIDADEDSQSAYHMGYESYTRAWEAHYRQVLTGLQQLYAFTWGTAATTDPQSFPTRSFGHLFRTLMSSYHRTVEPVARYAEAGLLIGHLREAGLWESFEAGMARIEQNRDQSAEAHLDIMTGLLTAALGDRSTKVFSSADLRAIGIDDTQPELTDHLHDAWENY